MIPTRDNHVYEVALEELQTFGAQASARGRFIALYLGLRRMKVENKVALLGSEASTPARSIEEYMDTLFEKTLRAHPDIILTAPFGGSANSYSTKSGELAPDHSHPTNTWRNNFGIQKGIGCPASPDEIRVIIGHPAARAGCPHIETLANGNAKCGLRDTATEVRNILFG